MMKVKKQIIIDTVTDMVTDLLYYHRKEDEDLPVGAIEQAVEDGTITIDEILQILEKELRQNL